MRGFDGLNTGASARMLGNLPVQDYLRQLAEEIRLADLFDIAVIAVLLYLGITWFRQRASRSLVVGLLLVAGLFLCAHWFHMYLTAMLFRAGFTAALLALVVVFQQDIRRTFEKLASSRLFRRPAQAAPHGEVADTLVESVSQLAHARTGALLVFEGREPLERHVRGGVPVDGCISEPLLQSIFHPESPGHDGAVLIDGERIDRLGVHLPLCTDPAKVGAGGTRHAAALGLAERCDALVVVVSEERGTISVAQHGKLEVVEPVALAKRLADHYQVRPLAFPKPAWHGVVPRNLGLKAGALALAAALWLLLVFRVETVQKTLVVPVEYRNLAETWTVDAPRSSHVELTVSGSERAFEVLDATEVAVSFDLEPIRSAGVHVLRTSNHVRGVPSELHVNEIRPGEIEILVRPRADEQPETR